MIHIKRHEEPQFWSEYKQKHPSEDYNDLQNTEEGRIVRNKLREYNIDQQHGLCAYCCKGIELDNSLNEHIMPRGIGEYSVLSMEYSNIIVSCNVEGKDATCSAAKKNIYSSMFVSPLEEDCEDHFEFNTSGEIVSDSDRGKYTIDVLNLNSYRLCNARKAQLRVCDSYNDPDMVKKIFLEYDDDNRLQPYADIIKYFYGDI